MAAQHKENLKGHCRLCGMKTAMQADRQPYKKETFSRVIFQALNIEVVGEDDEVFPPFICKVCDRKLARFKTKKGQKRAATVNISLPSFKDHCEDCSICVDNERVNMDALLGSCVEAASLVGLTMVKQGDRTLFVNMCTTNENICTVPKCVTVYNDATWHVSIVGQHLKPDNSLLLDIPVVLEKDSARKLMTAVGTFTICVGNPDFVEFLAEKGSAPSRAFVLDRAYAIQVENENISATVRSANCKLIADKKNNKCNVCSFSRGDLVSWKDKDAKDSNTCKTIPSSKTKLSYLSPEQLKTRLRKLRHEKNKSDKKLNSLQKRMKQMFEKESFKDTTNEDVMENLIKSSTAELEEVLPPNSAVRYLWEEQKKALKVKDKRQIRWSPKILRWCIAIHHKSPATYKLLKESGLLILPASSTLHSYTHFADAKSGIHAEIIEEMVKEMDLSEDFRRNVSILFDEMKLKSGLAFSSTGRLMGFVDVGDINRELRVCEEDVDGAVEPPLASHAFMLMARGIFSSTQQAIALFPSSMLRSSDIYDCIMESVIALEAAGLKVRALVSDGASVNRKFYKMCSPSSDAFHWSVHPLDSKRKIFFFCDVPHLLKTTRNNLENSGYARKSRNLKFRGKELRWTHLLSLFEWDTKSDLRMLPKVSHDHLYLNPSLRMRVKLATQVLSQSVANAFKAMKEEKKDASMDGTCEFIELMNKFFDCLNVSGFGQGRRKRNANLLPYESISDTRFDWLQNVFLKYFEDWQREISETPNLRPVEKERRCISKETREGFRITVSSFIELTKELLQEDGVQYVLSEKFTQDPIEEYFSKQRRAGGSNDNPSVQQVANNMLSIQVAGSAIRASKAGNVEQKGSSNTSDCPLPKKRKQKLKD